MGGEDASGCAPPHHPFSFNAPLEEMLANLFMMFMMGIGDTKGNEAI
jgi:hypothetical protein